MTNPTQIHAHEALAFIDASGGEYNLAELPLAIAGAFGESARFHACSAQDMDAVALTRFFIERAKIVERNGKVYLNQANICTHSD